MTYIIRTAGPNDLQSLYQMAKSTGGGFTNLPPDKNALRIKLERAAASFASKEESPSDQLYLMVLENVETGEVHGTCQIFGQIGQRWPFYSYRIAKDSKHSEQLNRSVHTQLLMLSNDLSGCSEVGGLFLHPAARASGLGALLARSRYLFIALHRQRFAERILAELRGVIGEAGTSPFWDGVAGKLFGMTFQEADEFNAIHGNQFIADLMPKHPIYIAMLSEAAQQVIGVPHPSGRAAMRMLENEGFTYDHHIDIFDGGPTLVGQIDRLKTVKNAKKIHISNILPAESANPSEAQQALIATGRLAGFRCCFGSISEDGAIDEKSARLLKVETGRDILWIGL